MLVAQPKDLDENMLKSNIGGPILGLDENKFWFWLISKGPWWNWVWNFGLVSKGPRWKLSLKLGLVSKGPRWNWVWEIWIKEALAPR